MLSAVRRPERRACPAHHQGRPSVDDDPLLEDDAAAAMGSQNRWLLPSQEARQDRPAPGSQGASQIGSHYRQRAREDVGEDQIEAALSEGSILITIGPADPY